MNTLSVHLRSKLTPIAMLFTAALPAVAQTPITGNIYDGSGGPLLTGVVYHVNGNIALPAGQTLTIQPGAIIKFVSAGASFSISGTLNSNGTSGNPVIFTDIRDDTAGGDTNGDGAGSAPAAGLWRSLYLYGGSSGALTYTQFRYSGQAGYCSLDVQAATSTFSFTNCTMRNGSSSGMQFNNVVAPITVSNCTFQNNAGAAMENVPLSMVPNFTNNIATGNGGNFIRVTSATVGANLTLNANNCLGGALMVATNPSVSSGVTLTVNQGVVFKAQGAGQSWSVSGKIVTNGTSGNPVVFTELRDDTAGGDTNNDGNASAPAAGFWRSLYFYAGSATSSLNYTEFRYNGQAGYSGVDFQAAVAIAIDHCTFRNCSTAGLQCNAIAHGSTISNCTFQNNAGSAIEGANINDVDQFTNNTVSGNGGNYTRITSANVAADMTLNANNCMGGALVVATNPDVPLGVTLTLNAGVVFKAQNAGEQWSLLGKLNTNGSSGSPVVFTELRDDTAGGDTNGDAAATVPAPGFWRSLFIYAGAAGSALNHCEVRYSGQAGYSCIDFQSTAAITITNSKFRFSSSAGIHMNGNVAPVTVSGCAFNNNGVAVESVPITIVPGFTNNTAANNGGNFMRVNVGAVNADTTISANNCLGGALVVATNVDVNAGKTLTLNPGVVWKWQNAGSQMLVNGALVAQGIAGSNVVFTEIRDDTAGGDTNNDLGASSPVPGFWRSLFIYATATGTSFDYAELRYMGQAGYAGIDFQGAAPITINTTRFRYGAARGVDLSNTASAIQMRRCSFENNGGIAVDNVLFQNVPGFIANTATGNGGNYIRVTNSTITSDITVGAEQCMGGALVVATNITVPSGATLTFEPGVVIKFQNAGSQVIANGGLVARGGITTPVVFTEFRDDGIVGDTNGDGGASSPAKSFWRGLFLYSTPQPSKLDNVLLRYCGQAGYAGVTTNGTGLTTLSNVRVEHTGAGGFDLTSLAAEALRLVAWDCDGNGVLLVNGPFNVRQATCVACGTGFRKNSAAWTGTVRDSIAWANTANYAGFAPANVAFSDGLVGGTGNINSDPLFVNQATGDLHLTVGSPCINTGDPASPLDPNCSGVDMGAYPVDNGQAPFTYCTGKANSAGCVPAIVFNGNASMTSANAFDVRAIDVVNNKSGLFFYGFNGQLNLPFQGGFKCVADPVKRLPIINSGGSLTGSDCTGVFAYDLKALIQGGSDVQLIAGATVDLQCWYRDPAVFSTTGLSNALQFRICN